MTRQKKSDNNNNNAIWLNRRFSSLQDYLDWGKTSNIADVPHYREISDGQYQIVPSRGLLWDKTIYSYEELRNKLGFSR